MDGGLTRRRLCEQGVCRAYVGGGTRAIHLRQMLWWLLWLLLLLLFFFFGQSYEFCRIDIVHKVTVENQREKIEEG